MGFDPTPDAQAAIDASAPAIRALRIGLAVLFVASVLMSRNAPAPAQAFFPGPSSRFDLSDSIRVPEIDAATKTQLERVRALVADDQWDEAILTITTVMESSQGQLVSVDANRYLPARTYCHMLLASLPPEAVARYRERVDPQARQWFETTGTHRVESLRRIIDELQLSSLGDDALLALGELALERGELAAAREYWGQIVSLPPPAVSSEDFKRATEAEELPAESRELIETWYRPDASDPPAEYWIRTDQVLSDAETAKLTASWRALGLIPKRLAYPDTDLDLAAIRARLVLVSILEGSTARASAELEVFRKIHPEAKGRLGGREVKYVDALTALLESSGSWTTSQAATGWPTFAGDNRRTGVAGAIDSANDVIWQVPLPEVPELESGYPSPRIGERQGKLLSYHPLVCDNLILVATAEDIRAFDSRTGKPAWGNDPVIFAVPETVRESHLRMGRALGTARFTMSVDDGRLFVRVGDLLTSRPESQAVHIRPASLVCLDLRGEGRMLWEREVPGAEWAFDGAPVCEGSRVYATLRRSEVRPQLHVACYDAATGTPLWQQFVCAAESPARGQLAECTHNLLTLAEDMIYLNTNMGAVAGLERETGQLRWVAKYPRVKTGDLNARAAHFYRDLTPCVYDRGCVFVAPADSPRILALDARNGTTLWETHVARDAVHLLGVRGNRLWASGQRLWWFDVASGKVGCWPEGDTPRGFGRGLLAGQRLYWPAAQALYEFDIDAISELSPPRPKRQIELSLAGVSGGNLVPVDDELLIAGSRSLVRLGRSEQLSQKTAQAGSAETQGPTTDNADEKPAKTPPAGASP